MRVYTHNARFYLQDMLRVLTHHRQGWRCVHLAQRGEELPGRGWRMLVGRLEDMLEAHQGTMFVCAEGDVILLFHGRATPIINALSRLIYNYELNDHMMLRAYDLTTQWYAVEDLCAEPAFGYLPTAPAAQAHGFTDVVWNG